MDPTRFDIGYAIAAFFGVLLFQPPSSQMRSDAPAALLLPVVAALS